MRLIVCLLVFVILAAEGPRDFAARWGTPMAYLFPFVDRLRALPFSLWDLAMGAVGAAVLLKPSTWRGRAYLLDVALLLSLAGICAAITWGAIRGGDVRQSYYQVAALLQLLLATHVITAVFRNGRDYLWLGAAVLAAALYRAVATMVFYLLFLRDDSLGYYPESIAGHDVSGVWVVALLGLASWVLIAPSTRTILLALPLAVLLVTATHYNNRRLAWVALVGGLAMVYLGMPIKRLSPRAKLWALALAPLLAAYVAVGWNRPYQRIFAPVAKLQSAIVGDDDSSRSRDIENTGLVLTLRLNLPLGAGLGHEYIEVSPAFSQGMQAFFPQYRYIPHNALLGLMAFTGVLLFPVIWTPVPLGSFLAARASLFARSHRDRRLAMVAFATPFVYSVMAFGDMGIQSTAANVLLAAGFGAASRLAVNSGAWGRQRGRTRLPGRWAPRAANAVPGPVAAAR